MTIVFSFYSVGLSVPVHWSEGSPVRRVTGRTVVVADVDTVSKREDGNTGDGKLMCRKNYKWDVWGGQGIHLGGNCSPCLSVATCLIKHEKF